MGLEEFANEVLKEVMDKAGDKFSAGITKNLKNNGVKRMAIITANPEKKGSPSVYLEEFYEEYKNGSMEISRIAEEVYQNLMEHMDDLEDVSLDGF